MKSVRISNAPDINLINSIALLETPAFAVVRRGDEYELVFDSDDTATIALAMIRILKLLNSNWHVIKTEDTEDKIKLTLKGGELRKQMEP